MTCKHCEAFYKRYSCAKHKPGYDGECDCPKCQGYCECYKYVPGETWPTDNAGEAFKDVWKNKNKLMFLDEIPTASKRMKKAMYKALLRSRPDRA